MTTTATRRRATKADPTRTELLRLLDEAYAGPAWHGPSVRGALRGLTAEDAQWRAAPGRNSVWDLVLHLAYTRHRVRGRLLPDDRGTFPRRLARPWWPLPNADADASLAERWRRDLGLLDEQHRLLLDAVSRVPLRRLAEPHGHNRLPLRQHVSGVALHDAYHAGQMRVIIVGR